MSTHAKQLQATSAFKNVVEETPDVTGGYRTGLQALGTNACKVLVKETRQLEGSVDIDACTQKQYPQDNRWDYVFAYKGKLYFVEVHPASTSEVSTVIKKHDWLRQWLKDHAPKLDSLPKGTPAYYWIQTKDCHIPRTSKQYRSIAQRGLIPVSMLKL